MPAPKKTLSTVPMAASSGNLVWSRIHCTAITPNAPLAAAPISRIGRLRPSSPSAVATRKPRATPGRVAWLMASLTSARRRSSTKTPITPAPAPSKADPNRTTLVL